MGGKSKGSSQQSQPATVAAPPPAATQVATSTEDVAASGAPTGAAAAQTASYSANTPQPQTVTGGVGTTDNNLAVGDQQAQTRASGGLAAGNVVANDTVTEEERRRLGLGAPVGMLPTARGAPLMTSRGGGIANSAILTG